MEVLHEKEAGHDGLHRDAKLTNSMTGRSLLADSSQSRDEIEEYISYRSCMPPIDEEKLFVLDLEVDTDSGGTIEYNKFIFAMLDSSEIDRVNHLLGAFKQDDRLFAAFKFFDMERNGYITKDELE